MLTQEEIAMWDAWLETDDGRGYAAGWGDNASEGRMKWAARGRAWAAGRIAERRENEAEIARLRGIIDVITGPPLTAEEAEAAIDDLPELDADERDATSRIDIKKIIAYATDPLNMSPEEVVRRLIEAARVASGFDDGTLREAEAWLERRWA